MKYLFFCLLFFLSGTSFAQNNEESDNAITNVYADTAKVFQQNNLRYTRDSNAHFYLVKVEEPGRNIFKKPFKAQIKRQLNEHWFIILAKESSIQQNRYIVKYLVANNYWKLSPALLGNRSEFSSTKKFAFLIETSDVTEFEDFLHQQTTEASILSSR